jgi:hypothetical protein
MGKLSDSPFQSHAPSEQSIEVAIVSLDSWCLANGVTFPNVMKIDVEGAELLVLRGAKRILRESRPKLFIEAHSRVLASEVLNLLHEQGYLVRTLETGSAPDGHREPEVCHLIAVPSR